MAAKKSPKIFYQDQKKTPRIIFLNEKKRVKIKCRNGFWKKYGERDSIQKKHMFLSQRMEC